MNKVILTGRLVADPERKTTPKGTSVTTGAVAVNDRFGKEKTVSFIDYTAWSASAEYMAKYLHKGDLVEICGRWTQQTWTGRDGKNHRKDLVTIEEVNHIGERKDGQNAGPANPSGGDDGSAVQAEDIPF